MKKENLRIAAALAVFLIMAAVIAIVNSSSQAAFAGSFWAIVPPLVAIVLALITKEAYSSLFAGIVLGGLMVSGCNLTKTVDVVTVDGLTTAVTDNAGILIFLVFLGTVVALINKTGASRAFGTWAQKHIHTKATAQLATFALGVLIFIDDYFNCLTVGSVMSAVTDSKRISRVKLAYIIDATAAPVCMIAPVSSWAAAVSGCVESTSYSGIGLFVRAIPFNFYSLYTLVFVVTIILLGFDYGKMAGFEIKANQTGELGVLDMALDNENAEMHLKENSPEAPPRGKLFDLILSIGLLIAFCVWGLLHNGYQSIGSGSIIDALSETDAYVGLPWGGLIALVVIILYLNFRKVISFKESMECVPKGFMAMIPAITILTLAGSLKNMTNALEAKLFVQTVMESVRNLQWAIPAVVFVVACVIAFATGTSWGTFGILIPIVSVIFPESSQLFFVGISACLAGAVCGDHCSPISDTTIMSSAGAHCNHLDHVETQLPYAISVAGISMVTYVLAGLLSLVNLTWVAIPAGAVLTVVFLVVMKGVTARRKA